MNAPTIPTEPLHLMRINENIRYEPEERPPHLLSAGLGFQATLTLLPPIVVIVAIIVRSAGQSESYLTWAVFSAMVISGAITVLQSMRVGRFGSGNMLFMGTSSTFLIVCVLALESGGPALMATLIVLSSVFYFLLAWRLSLLRRVITPLVSGVVIMLLSAMAAPIVFDMIGKVPENTPSMAAPIVAAVTFAVVLPISLRAPLAWQLWAPVIGVAAGCVVSSLFGLYDFQSVAEASWVGIPTLAWPGFDISFNAGTWALLATFMLVAIVSSMETIGDGVAVQEVSRRRARATDFRVIQGALNADGLGNLLSGIAGTVPNTTYSSSIPLIALTGVAARRVGIYAGIILVIAAFLPKIAAALLAIPGPVVGAYLTVLIGLVFVEGLRAVFKEGINQQKALILGVSFWVGLGFEYRFILPDLLSGAWETLLGNGMVVGGAIAIILTALVGITRNRPIRIRTDLDYASLPQINEFLRGFALRAGWDEHSTERLCSAGEETLACLLQEEVLEDSRKTLLIRASIVNGIADLEFSAAPYEENLEDRLTYLTEQSEIEDDREISFRLLRHYASSVKHQKYHSLDLVAVKVQPIGYIPTD
ncbi:MAG: purine/pyrimidine permease [Chloroflexota bacterium]|nr:purine/pyrimidine permease [Chloroflexota bacterium]